MPHPLRLNFTIHNHQPIGNFDGVFQESLERSYAPFLDVLSEFPELPVSVHFSGSLLEWLVQHRPEYVDRVREFVDRGQIEILGGAFYEPILASIPRADRVGQIRSYRRYLEQAFGTQVRGMWVPERVWEQAFASDIVDAGIEFTILDDFHFKNAGLAADDLHGYFLTEDEGRLLKVFPGSEPLRYMIPFSEPQESIDYMRSVAEKVPNAVLTFADDGEKFGGWPGTYDHVFGEKWLHNFFSLLMENREWLQVVTFGEILNQVAPLDRCYLPDASYREMTEWALSTDRQRDLIQLTERHEQDEDWDQVRSFMRGGFWRNFRVKYSEANEMYARMLEISQRLQQQELTPGAAETTSLESSRSELYRAQCNCPYWHGAFGGLYLPHLRHAIYEHLIAADTELERGLGRAGAWTDVRANDFNLDARQEVRLANDRLVAYLAPARGGHLYELDIRTIRQNLLATLNRRPEPYHDIVAAAADATPADAGIGEIHNAPKFKQPNLEQQLQYDAWPRKSLVDHFLPPDIELEAFRAGEGEVGEFVEGVYDAVLRSSEQRVEVRMTRGAQVGSYAVVVTKTIGLNAGSQTLEIDYTLDGLPSDVPLQFAVEFNFAGLPAGQSDRYYYDGNGRTLGPLEAVQSLEATSRLGLMDEWKGLDIGLEFSEPTRLWTFPIQTVSQSEGGFELVHQSCCVVPRWVVMGDSEGRWSVRITQIIDTSAAEARKLGRPPANPVAAGS